MNRLETLTRTKMARKPESSAVIQSRLNEAKALESEAKEKLERLHRKKAMMPESVHLNRQMDDLVNSIKLTEAEIADIPYRIDVLKLRLAESREQESVKRKILKTYRESSPASELKKKSMLLLKKLRAIQKTNSELLAMHKQRQLTEEETGQKIDAHNTCGGFYSLEIILKLCERENNGSGREFVTWEKYPFQKI